MENLEFIDDQLNNMCRTCLKQLLDSNSNRFDIFMIPNLAKWLTVCTSLIIEENDGYPRLLCNKCCEKVQDFFEFREMCLDSIKKFEEIRHHSNSNYEINLIEIKNDFENNQYDEEQQLTIENNDSFSENGIKIETNPLENISDSENENYNNDNKHKNDHSDEENQKRKTKKRNKLSSAKCSKKSINDIFTCKICSKRFFKEEKYNAHIRTHSGLKPWECSYCKKQYNKSNSLKFHIKHEHGPKEDIDTYVCTYEGCEKSYKHKETLKTHIKNTHTECGKGKASYICEECGKSMSSLAGLRRHRLTHSGEYPFKCDICVKRYRTKYKLSEHMKRHNGVKNYICSICGLKKFSQHELNVHMKFHTKEKQSKCSYCPYTSGNIGNVKRHEKIVHHGIKAYTCIFCGNSFGKSETLKHHVMTHTGEKPHECNLCGRRFIQMTALKTHLKRHEKNAIKNPKSTNSRIHNQLQEEEEEQQSSELNMNCIENSNITNEISLDTIITTTDNIG